MENLDYYNRDYKRQERAAFTVGEKTICPNGSGGLEDAVCVPKRTLYIGHFHTSHYGNFLFDNLARLWYVASHREEKLLFAYTGNGFDLRNYPAYLHVLSYFGIAEDNLLHITKPTCFSCLIEPEPSFIHDKYYTLDYVDVYDHIKSQINISKYPEYEKVYFTRTHLKRHKEVGEAIFEKFFQMNGYTVLAPESLSFEEQVSIVNNCSVLASIEGTLAHNFVFANREGQKRPRQIILKKQSYIIPRQFMINQAIGIPAEYIEVYREPFRGFPINYDRGPFLLCWNDEIRQFAAKEGMKVTRVSCSGVLSDYIVYTFKCIYYLFKHVCKKFYRFLKQ